jgi:hypothetical protein
MTLAHDTTTRFPATDGPSGTNSVDTTTGNRTFSHAGSASAKAAVVVLCFTGNSEVVSGVLYGGVAMTNQAAGTDTSEAGVVQCWVLASPATVPTGTQTVTLQGCTATAKWATCSTLTASAGNAVFHTAGTVDTTIAANPSVALTTTKTTLCYGGVHSGAAAPPSVPTSGSTLLKQNDYGVLGSSTLRRTSPDASGTVTLGYTLASDDHCMAAIAFAEQPVHDATATISIASTQAGTGITFTPHTPGPLSDADIVQSNTGTFTSTTTFQDFPITLPAAAGYGNAVIVATFFNRASVGNIFPPGTFTQDSPGPSNPAVLYVFRRAAVGEGESSWMFQQAASGVVTQWVALEVAGLAAAPVDAVSAMTLVNPGTSLSPAVGAGTSYDTVQFGFYAAGNNANTTVPTWSGYTPSGFVEVADAGAVDGAGAVSLAVARRFPASAAGVTASATTTQSGPLAAVVVSYASASGRVTSDVGDFWGFEQGTLAGATLGSTPVFNATAGSPAITSSTPRTGSYCLELTATAGVCSATRTAPFGTSRIGAVRVPLRLVGSLPAGDVDLFSLEMTGCTLYVRFRSASSKLGVQLSGSGIDSAERLSSATVTADAWLAVEVQYDTRTSADFRADWAVDYGDGTLVDQAPAQFVFAAANDVTTLRLGWATNATATVRTDDVVVVKAANNYPIRDHTVHPLTVDAGALVTTSDAKFNTYSSNGTLAAWDGTVAQAAIDDVPPTVSASADGIAQVTSGASDYMTIPVTSYDLGGIAVARAVRMLLAGWAASGTAATLGFRAFDGTTEMLLATAADPAFDNSTSQAVWVSLPVRPASGAYAWTQAKLDALELRVGFGDAAVAVGLHAVLCEVLVQPSAPVAAFGEAGSVTATAATDAVSGEVVVTVATPPERPATVRWVGAEGPGSQLVPAGSAPLAVAAPASATEVGFDSEAS